VLLQPFQGEYQVAFGPAAAYCNALTLRVDQSAVNMLAKCLAMEWRDMGITVNW
jgi:NAD(P)-dependent dehydrogenase (short-subunit alcohol dehydrogenase family)